MVQHFKAMMVSVLGANWFMRLCGILTAVETVAEQVLAENPIPTTPTEWKILGGKFVAALILFKTKGSNVSNSPDPHDSVEVPPKDSIKPNPAAPLVVPCLLLVMLTGCASFMNTNTGAVLLKIHQDAQSVLVAGCAGMPARHVLIGTVLPFIPPQYGLPAQGALAIETVAATALCAQVQATPELVKPFVPSAPAVNSAMPVDTTPPVLIGPKP